MVSMGDGNWQFFQGNTRRSRIFKLQAELGIAIGNLNGLVPLDVVAMHSRVESQRLVELTEVLHAACLIEYAEVAKRIAQSPWRRVLNFIGDFIPSDAIEDIFCKLNRQHVVILGVGGVGSWIATQLCQSGFEHFVLVDDDQVELSNLNRSLYSLSDVGRYKVDALADRLSVINSAACVQRIKQRLSMADFLADIIDDQQGSCIVGN